MMMPSEFLIILLMFFGAGPTSGNDLLDMIPTNSYWLAKHVTPTVEQLEQDTAPEKAPENVKKLIADLAADDFKTRENAKKALEAIGPAAAPLLKSAQESKDPEVAAVANTLVKQFAEHGKERDVRRLMAIRTLGERKEKTALPTLKALIDSKDLFVSDYALRAVAQIEGNKLTRIDHRKELAADVKLLPKNLSFVGQATGLPGTALTLDKILDQALDPANQNPFLGGPNAGGKNPDKKIMLARLTNKLLELIDRVGNIRLDGITVGVSDNAGPNGGFGVVIFRGKYDRAAMVPAFKSLNPDDVKQSRNGDADILEFGSDSIAVFPNNDLFIFIVGDRNENKSTVAAHILGVLNSGKAGGGDHDENKELAALMKTVDTTGPAWGVLHLNEDMKKEQTFAPFDTVTLSTKVDKDTVHYSVIAKGTDAEKVKASVDETTKDIQQAIVQVKQIAGQMKQMQALVDLLESIKVAADGTTAKLDGDIKPAVIQNAIGGAAPNIWVELGGMEDNANVPGQPQQSDGQGP
jgi:hypothetical protein